jgi:hypothetical protein
LWLSGAYEPIAFGATPAILTPIPCISYQSHNHIGDLGYDSRNNQRFIATRHGIFIWKEGELFQLGQSRDDFMGRSLHPANFDVLYTSSHPKSGLPKEAICLGASYFRPNTRPVPRLPRTFP